MLGGDHSHPGVQLAAWNVTEVGYIYNIYNRYIYMYIYIYIYIYIHIYLQHIYLQRQSYPWDNCHHLATTITCPLRGNTLPI